MHLPLGHSDAGMSRQLHDCKCIRSCLPQPGEEGVSKSVENELSWEENLFFTVYDWLADATVEMIQACYQNWSVGRSPRKH